MAFLEDLVNCDKGLECLDLVGKDWLPIAAVKRVLVVPLWLEIGGLNAGVGPTLSCPARKTPNSCDPMCRQYMLAHAFLCIKVSAGGVSLRVQTYV
jgi:hypothetical protein